MAPHTEWVRYRKRYSWGGKEKKLSVEVPVPKDMAVPGYKIDEDKIHIEVEVTPSHARKIRGWAKKATVALRRRDLTGALDYLGRLRLHDITRAAAWGAEGGGWSMKSSTWLIADSGKVGMVLDAKTLGGKNIDFMSGPETYAPSEAAVDGARSYLYQNQSRRRLLADMNDVSPGTPLPIPDKSFDSATMVLGYKYLENPSHALKEIKRILKKDGRLIIVNDPGAGWEKKVMQRGDAESISAELAKAGFHVHVDKPEAFGFLANLSVITASKVPIDLKREERLNSLVLKRATLEEGSWNAAKEKKTPLNQPTLDGLLFKEAVTRAGKEIEKRLGRKVAIAPEDPSPLMLPPGEQPANVRVFLLGKKVSKGEKQRARRIFVNAVAKDFPKAWASLSGVEHIDPRKTAEKLGSNWEHTHTHVMESGRVSYPSHLKDSYHELVQPTLYGDLSKHRREVKRLLLERGKAIDAYYSDPKVIERMFDYEQTRKRQRVEKIRILLGEKVAPKAEPARAPRPTRRERGQSRL